jgi:hypothetical protein
VIVIVIVLVVVLRLLPDKNIDDEGRRTTTTIRENTRLCAQIIDQETEFGTRLLERTNQRVSLTVAGRSFVSGARKTLESALQAVETAQQASLNYRGELRIANVGLVCPALLAQLISAFCRGSFHPDLCRGWGQSAFTTAFRWSVRRSLLSQAHRACRTFSAQPGLEPSGYQSVSQRLSKCGPAYLAQIQRRFRTQPSR